MNLAVQPVGAGRDVDGTVLVEGGLEGSTVVGPTVAHGTEILDRDGLGELARDGAARRTRKEGLERQAGQGRAARGVAAGLGDDQLVLGNQGRRCGQLVDLLIGHWRVSIVPGFRSISADAGIPTISTVRETYVILKFR